MVTKGIHRRVRSATAPGAVLLAYALLLFPAFSASAQMVHLDPMLWTAPTDTLAGPSLEIRVDRFEEPKFGWAADRLLATLRLPVSPTAGFFVRLPHATFDFGDTPLFQRWPWLEPVQSEEDAVGAQKVEFWSERRVTSFGQIEIGGDRRTNWPLLGAFAYGGALGLPTGSDRLYPISSISFPIRLEMRKTALAASSLQLDLEAGYLVNVDSGGATLDETAFPDGWHAGASLRLGTAQGRRLHLAFDHQDREGRLAQRATAALTLPRGERSSWTVQVDRELAGSLDRFAAWRFSIAWRLDQRSRTMPDPGSQDAALERPVAGPGAEGAPDQPGPVSPPD